MLDHIVAYICKELAEIEAEKRAEAELSDNFDEFLKIAPAPTTTGKNPLASNNFYYNVESVDSPARKEKERTVERQTGRNKLGTVFSERVIVSPVPYVVTTRESFCTLRKTPIQYRLGDVLDVPTIRPGELALSRQIVWEKCFIFIYLKIISSEIVKWIDFDKMQF